MFSIVLFIYLNIISLIIAQNERSDHGVPKFIDDNDTIIHPLELVLSSKDAQGSFYCNSRVDINKQRNKLTASIDRPILTSPTFQLKIEQSNSTTIRIDILPNGYIGTSRISCHWDNNATYGQTADLIIGDKPGVIQLKERCQAYDRRYVQCTFHAPTIARGFRNGFPRLYKFSELNPETSSYRDPPKLINITDNNELIFHFEPRDRNIIPKKISMMVNMTLSRFGSSGYYFNIEPVHTTQVDFQIENISKEQFTIRIKHNNTGTISQRLCSGHVSRVDNQKPLTAVQDIIETKEQNILINRLRSSTKYEICLRCYYEQTDQSFKEEKCVSATTNKDDLWIVLLIIATVAVVASISVIAWLVHHNRWCTKRPNPPDSPIRTNPGDFPPRVSNGSIEIQGINYTPVMDLPLVDDDHQPEPDEPLMSTDGTREYRNINGFMVHITDGSSVTPDTKDYRS